MIDEVQKVPKLLDTVHELIETKKIKFALTGSSARKLKKQNTNLLADTQSARESVKLQPKFYIFDLGIKRAIESDLDQKMTMGSSPYGRAFEHFVILEAIRLNSYYKKDFKISHYQTNAGGEIDLILSRGSEIIAVEIKSANIIDAVEVRKLARIAEPLKPKRMYYVSQDPISSNIAGVHCVSWKVFFEKEF